MIFRVEVEATVEAESEEEAWRVAGRLLAGDATEQGHLPMPVLGPGSWAPARRLASLAEAGP